MGDERAGAPGPGPTAPPLEKGRIMLDKFRRTGPASPGLGILLLLFDFSSKLTGGTAPWGLCWECRTVRSCTPPPTPPTLPHVCTDVYTHLALLFSPRLTLKLLPRSIAPRGPFPPHSGAGGQTGSSIVRKPGTLLRVGQPPLTQKRNQPGLSPSQPLNQQCNLGLLGPSPGASPSLGLLDA